jgi:ABC-2 type transport system ATP-binding protein/lipopolysaccharide transport system ATP-binding protein
MHSNGVSPYAVELEGVAKRYLLDASKPFVVKDMLRPRRVAKRVLGKQPFWALQDINLRIGHGEIVGVIGPNGSGKSSLLRILAGISPPTLGSVRVNGRYGALLELGAGFHGSQSGRQNAYLNALFMGMSKEQARSALPSIIEFSELGEFIDQPMRTYSSGMYLRLGFSVAIHMQPDILLVDEVLAVGDAEFQEKCFDHFRSLKKSGTTVIIVTHNLDTLADFADRAIMLERGRMRADGAPQEVIHLYMETLKRESPVMERILQHALAGRMIEQAMANGATRESITEALIRLGEEGPGEQQA